MTLSSAKFFECRNYRSMTGPSQFRFDEGLCSENGAWALWLYGNQCRLMFCGPSSEMDGDCNWLVEISSPSWTTYNACPSQEGYDRYVKFLSNGDLVIFSDRYDDGDYLELWRLSTDSDFGSSFTDVGEGVSKLTVHDSGKVDIVVDDQLVWSIIAKKRPTHEPTNSPILLPTVKQTNTPDSGRKPTSTPGLNPVPTTVLLTDQPTYSPTASTTLTSVGSPTLSPTDPPTKNPTGSSTREPTKLPTKYSTGSPTLTPIEPPPKDPTGSPTLTLTDPPTTDPTGSPTLSPTELTTKDPTGVLTLEPSTLPTIAPTGFPTKYPTKSVTRAPSKLPTNVPTESPTDNPTRSPTLTPTESPTTLSPTTSAPTSFICVELQTQDATAYVEKLKTIYRGVSGKNVQFSNNSSDRSNAFNFIRDERFCANPPEMIQRYISALFYFSTKGDNWEESISWLSSRHECEWKGIKCDKNLIITSIERDENNLAGTIPYELCGLPLLKKLDLDNNQIGGTIPRGIGRCRNLQTLDIDTNLIIGSFPESIFDIPDMMVLDVDKNMLTGTLSNKFGNWEELQFLSIYSNEFEGGIPESLGKLKKLSLAYLDNNNLTGMMPNAVCKNVPGNEGSASNSKLFELTADCKGSNLKVICDCCTACY
eukprot:CAMPEP_0194345604 /NCGR_PEP_ID=MMETSP0171-20130528/104952_1 /TAXON_ID=218684 /ORGANISM="Corethron pennatum, Strain L29A3" /LENGTH=647 /DNA_ID=CAMNT_0039112615 /DNA_START=551 /DNA_END=2494 /DNA_ORIENTATION=-